jgi:hypothetical protein
MKATLNQLKKQQVYLNNLVKDEIFIELGYKHNLVDYFISFPSETTNVKKLCKYIDVVECMFMTNGIEYKHLDKY